MKDILSSLEEWRRRGEEIALATVVNTWGSSPRPVGSKLAVTRSGKIAGSVSGGCVEGAVIIESELVLDTNQPKLLNFGVADEDAWEVGLPCGGNIQVFVEPFSAWEPIYEPLLAYIEDRRICAVISQLKGDTTQTNHKLLVDVEGNTHGGLQLSGGQEQVRDIVTQSFVKETSIVQQFEDDTSLFVELFSPTGQLIIIGAVHTAEKLVAIGQASNLETIVIDPRRSFLTRERFPTADQLVAEWPDKALEKIKLDNSAYVVVLTHDPKLDDPALLVSLRSEARYIGALGSQRTNKARMERLRQAGLNENQLARLHAPIGLNIGARLPEEIAVSILAEIFQVRSQRSFSEKSQL